MKKFIRKVIASTTSMVLLISSVSVAFTANAAPRDPNGHDGVTGADSLYIQRLLSGQISTVNYTTADFDKNGIISKIDADKVLSYLAGAFTVPNASDNDVDVFVNSSIRTYRKHNYSNSSLSTYSTYTLYPSTNTTSYEDDGISTCSIIGDNNMVPDNNEAVVKLSVGGTGFIISDNVIVTAAHCVYDRSTGRFIDNNISIVADNGNVIRTFKAKYAHIPENYITNNTDYDYALLYVNNENLTQYGKFDLGIVVDDYFTGAFVSGFPVSEHYPDTFSGSSYGLRFKASGNLTHDNTNEFAISYYIDMAGGDSGGPVYVEENYNAGMPDGNRSYRTAIAINTYEAGSYNFGTRITPDLLRFYYNNNYIN